MKTLAPRVASIVAATLGGGIGFRGRLPWTIPEELKWFEHATTCIGRDRRTPNGMVMGRRTWDSLPSKSRPLPNRSTVVVSNSKRESEEVSVEASVTDAINRLASEHCGTVYIVGGKQIYDEAHRLKLPDIVYWTRVCGDKIRTDVKIDLDLILEGYDVISISKTRAAGSKYVYDFVALQRKDITKPLQDEQVPHLAMPNMETKSSSQFPLYLPQPLNNFPKLQHYDHEEFQYLSIMENILDHGLDMEDRTGIGTLAKFGASMRFDLTETFPMLTTKRVYWKGVVEELLWFLNGCTNAKTLADKDVHIWDANGSKEFLKSRGLGHRQEGDLGPVYGFQWRHFGADYEDCNASYEGKGFDQVMDVIDQIKKDPLSRRMIISAWNPPSLKEMALPPCHMMCQFFVDPKKSELSCLMFQRSADWGLGVPFNIASYALLTRIIAQVTNLKAKELVHVIGNAHVYKNHQEPLREQLKRLPRPFPILRIDPSIKIIKDFKGEHFRLVGYEPLGTIKMDMAV